ncbi:TonB-dependent receptor domain-containing protein [Ichthyenterobacterium magnum]|uniref:Outer membrane receptor for ferrienterochelin and colicin n=1 Tax=Ichthyenterobacterium magnum TaxID=1230530 RepID=A0A420DFK8_9FLAO|nr:outer membrane beta-barrel family protein [Ichthyenterobacterium magnum]RKE92010.1 outer membrane receptor for ferrienterochelin and colicin [Ichthyenterobacterium magnum]
MRNLKQKKVFKIIVCVLLISPIYAQVKLDGFVYDEHTDRPIPYATIILKNSEDAFITGVSTNENGFYELNSEKGNYILQVNFIGYKTYTNPIDLNKDLTKNITLLTDELQLDEVTVIAEKTSVQQLIDKKIINVGKDILSSGGSAATVLSQLSEINADENGSISLRGNENVQILVNGKPSPLGNAELLTQISASEIKTIEIITSPSAKYRSDGLTGILNIITKKKLKTGITISNNLAVNSLGAFSGSSSLGYGKKKVSYILGVSYRKNKSNSKYERQRFGTFPYLEKSKSDYKGDVYRINAGLDWFLNKHNELSWAAQYSDNTHSSDIEGFITDINSTLQQNIFNKHIHRTFRANGNYRHNFEKEGNFFEIDAQITNNKNTLTGLFFPNINAIDNITKNKIQTTDLALDNVNQLNETIKLETGYLWHTRKLDNQRQLIDAETSEDNYNYKYATHAFYALTHFKLNHFEVQTGLRLELFNRNAKFVTENINVNSNFINLFPSLHFKYSENDAHTFGLGFNRRTSRPSIYQINPISQQSNEFTFREGNPNLESEFSNNIDVSYQYKNNTFSFSPTLSYQKKENSIYRNLRISPTGVQVFSYDNYSGSNAYGLEIALTYKPIKWLDSKFNFNWNYESLNASSVDFSSDFSRSYQFTFRNDFGINEKLKTNLSWRYQGSSVGLYQRRSELQNLDFGLRYALFNNDGNLSLRVTDIFNTRAYRGREFGEEFERFTSSKPSSRAIHLAFSYRFSKGSIEKRNKKKREYE